MTNNSYVGIPDRLKCTAIAGDYVALSSQIVTPSNPDDLEHSTFTRLSDINDNLAGKQDQLVSGTNIKTVNSQSLLGSGNIETSAIVADGSITGAKIANGAISSNKLDSSLASTISGKLDASSAFSGDYSDLTNKPTIPTVPTNISAFTNDEGYLTSSDLSDVAYLGNDDGTAAIADLSLNDIVRTTVKQDFTVSQSETVKENVFNKEALNYTTGFGSSVVYLKQHIDNQGDNVLTLSDFGDPQYVYNTIFIIDKEFIVQGTEDAPVVIPPNCKLLFLGGEFKNGYINVNGAEILPNYGNLKYNSFDSSLYPGMETTIIGTPKKGSWYFDRLLNLPVYFNGTDWILADGTPAFE